ncbi:hypothetical protein [Niveispirillum sp. KHB5.9]|uniref:hypothetical protein n=1 Tax=Niveispirillum sp. KHB5.9 TaxID=3400269 RepID=UPI003A880264
MTGPHCIPGDADEPGHADPDRRQPGALARTDGVPVMQDRTRLHRQTMRHVRL